MELRSFKVKSVHLDHQDLSKEYFLKPTPNGAIGHQFIIEYQTAIDELMKSSRYILCEIYLKNVILRRLD